MNRTMLRIHATATVVWLLLAIPTVLLWRNSVAWVAFMSLYANVASHWAAWQATRAEKAQAEDTQEG